MGNIVELQLFQSNDYKEFITYASFETEPTKKNRALAINLDVTKQELDSLFNTKKYERPYQPEYFNPIEDLIGELWSDSIETTALHLISEKVNQFIPRITVDSKSFFQKNMNSIEMNLIFYYTNDFTRALYNYKNEFNVVT